MKLQFKKELCTECHACELMCSMVHYGVYNTEKSALRVINNYPDSPGFLYCRQCPDAPCMEACSVEALTMQNGVVHLDQEECIACGLCMDACPFGAIFLTPEGQYFKCDNCGGEFRCTKACVTGALTVSKEDASDV